MRVRVEDNNAMRLLMALIGMVLLFAIFLWGKLPLQDPKSYFNFADQRMYLGIPNFFDVCSNLIFIYVGLWGMFATLSITKLRPPNLVYSIFLVNLSVFLTGWGSSFFHLMPNSINIFWDRTPMAIGFMSLLALIIYDRVNLHFSKLLLVTFLLVSVYTTWCASFGGPDIRPYVLLQFGSLFISLGLVLFRRPMFLNNKFLIIAFVLYALAKVLESYDHFLFDRFIMSGHSLKHIVAGFAIVFINLSLWILPKKRY